MDAETTAHFLLHSTERNKMLQEISPILESKKLCLPNDDLCVKFLLYGYDSLNINENRTVLNMLLKYIHKS